MQGKQFGIVTQRVMPGEDVQAKLLDLLKACADKRHLVTAWRVSGPMDDQTLHVYVEDDQLAPSQLETVSAFEMDA